MPTEPQPVTLAEVVQKAVEACDDGTSDELDDLLVGFEDADEPITAVDDIEERLDEVLGPTEEELSPAVTMARAMITYLAYRRDEIDAEPEDLLRLAARAEFGGNPPAAVAQWLAERSVGTD